MDKHRDSARWALMKIEGDLQTILETIEEETTDWDGEGDLPQTWTRKVPDVADHIAGLAALVHNMIENTKDLRHALSKEDH